MERGLGKGLPTRRENLSDVPIVLKREQLQNLVVLRGKADSFGLGIAPSEPQDNDSYPWIWFDVQKM